MKKITAYAAALVLAAFVTVGAYASGVYPGFPSATGSSGNPSATIMGTEQFPGDNQNINGVTPETVMLTPDQLLAGATVTDSTNGAITGTAAQYTGGGSYLTYVRLTGAISGATNAQLPTAASMYAVWNALAPYQNGTNAAVGKCWFVKVVNAAGTGSGVWTMTTNTGLTLAGNMTVEVASSRLLKFCFTSATAVTVTDYGR